MQTIKYVTQPFYFGILEVLYNFSLVKYSSLLKVTSTYSNRRHGLLITDRLSIIWNLIRENKTGVLPSWMDAVCLDAEKIASRKNNRMSRAIFNKSWKQHPTNQQLHHHLPPSHKLSNLDEQDNWLDTAGEVRTNT